MKQPIPIFEGDIVDGKLVLLDHVKLSISHWCHTFKTGTHVDIEISKHTNSLTKKQRGYYWSTVVPILADFFGYEKDEMHEELKLKFNPVPSKLDPSKMIGGSTMDMTTEEFFCGETSYVERICRWAATEYGCYVPPPKPEDVAGI